MLIHRFDKAMPLPIYGTAGAAGFDLHLSAIERPRMRHLPDGGKLRPDGFERTFPTQINGNLASGERGAEYLKEILVDQWDILPGGLVHARSGIGFAIPEGHYLDIRGRSGWTGCGLVVLNGTIDCDYLGEIGAHLVNLSTEPIEVRRGMRLFQAILKKIVREEFKEDDDAWAKLSTARGDAGFGSSGP